MKPIFNSSFFAGNRRRLRESVASDVPIFVIGNGTIQRNRDNAYAFRQNSNFWYLTGVDEPDTILIMHKGSEYLVIPDYDFLHSYFEGAPDAKTLSSVSGIANILQYKQAWPFIKKIAKENSTIAMNEPDPVFDRMHRIFTNPAQNHFLQRLKRQNNKLKVQDVRKYLMDMRWVKQLLEVNALQYAIDVTAEVFMNVQHNINSYTHESHIEADLSHHYAVKGCKHAYTPIVGAAERSCTLHYTLNNNPVRSGDVVLIDSGAEYLNYAADITRTFVRGKPTQLQKTVIKNVESAADYMISLLKPGVTFLDVLLQTESFIGEQLKSMKLITNTKSREQIHKYYPHASHFLGLDVHDVGDYRKPLVPGVVLTTEPGIYIPEKSVGARIEDDVIITDTGCRVLSNNLPKQFIVD